MNENKPNGNDKTVWIIVAAVLALLLIMILVPQSFWVNLSIKLFK